MKWTEEIHINTIHYINLSFHFANLYRFDNLNASLAIFINTIIQKYWIDLKRIKRIHKNVIYCHSVFPPRFPDLRWPHCTPYRLYKKFFPIFLTLFVPPLQTYEVMLPRSKLMCSLFLLFTFTTTFVSVFWGIFNNIQLSCEWFGINRYFK